MLWTPPRNYDGGRLADSLLSVIAFRGLGFKNYLRDMLIALLGTVARLATTRLARPPSHLKRCLERWFERPEPLVRLLDNELSGTDAPSAASDALDLVVYNLAALLFGEAAAHHLGPNGDVLAVWSARPDRRDLAREAAKQALAILRPTIQPGRGGPRRRPEHLRTLVIDHLLEIYVTVTGERPGVNVYSGGATAEKRISGSTIEFLEAVLKAVNLRTTRATLRRQIDEWNRLREYRSAPPPNRSRRLRPRTRSAAAVNRSAPL